MILVCQHGILTRPAGTDFTLQLHGEYSSQQREISAVKKRDSVLPE